MNIEEIDQIEGSPMLLIIGDEDDSALALATMENSSPVSDNPATVYLSSLTSEASRRGMASNLDRVAKFLLKNEEATHLQIPWAKLRFKHVSALNSLLVAKKLSPATIRVTMAGVRGVIRAAYNLDQISSEDYLRIRNVRLPRKKELREPRGRRLTDRELEALMASCRNDTAADARDQAILAVLFGAGLRREEIAILELENFKQEESLLQFIGKGNKERRVPLPTGTLLALNLWLDWRRHDPGPLFHPIHRSGVIHRDKLNEKNTRPPGALSPQAIYNILKKRAIMAAIPRCSPHDGRRTLATNLIDMTGDISLVQKILGHSDVATTTRYDMRGEEAGRRAVGRLHIPVSKT